MQEWRNLILATCLLRVPATRLGTTVQMLKNVCRDDKLVTDLIDEAVRNPRGRPKKNRDNVTNLDGPTGNSRDKALRRLRDQRHDLHALVLADEMSAHRAMIEAGFRSRTFTVPDDIDAAAATLKQRFGDQLFVLMRTDALILNGRLTH